MARVGVVPRGVDFLPFAARWIEEQFAQKEVLVFVPHGRAARVLRGLVKAHVTVVPLHAEAVARVAGIEVRVGAGAWRVQEMILRVVAEMMPEVDAARRMGMAAELAEVVGRLQAQGVRRARLVEEVPAGFAAHWEVQSAVLVACLEAVEKLASEEVRAREVFRLAGERAEVLRRRYVCVAAGIWDAPYVAGEMLRRLVADDGWTLLPEGGAALAALRTRWLTRMGGGEEVRLGEAAEGRVREVVYQGPWEEVEGVAALAARMEGKVAVVSASAAWARRLRGALAARGVGVAGGFGSCLVDSAAGALWKRVLEAMAAPGAVRWAALRMGLEEEKWGAVREAWRGLGRRAALAEWVDAAAKVLDAGWTWRGMDGADAVMEVLRAVEMEGDFERGAAAGILLEALKQAPRAADEDARVEILGARDARLLGFGNVIVAGAVDAMWPGGGGERWLAPAQARGLGLGDAAQRALLLGAEMEALLWGGGRVWLTRHGHDGGTAVLPSRFLRGVETAREEPPREAEAPREALGLGSWTPRGEQYPAVWSASFVETLMACPYRAYAQRVLRMVEVEPVEAAPDARVGGLVVHRWLERMDLAGTDFGRMDDAGAAALQARMVGLVEGVLEVEDAVTRAIWAPKLKKLAPVLVARWREDGRRVESVEKDARREVGKVTVRAIVDRVERAGEELFIIDYKTGTLPEWREVAAGLKPQLALEGWLLGGAAGLEYWKLRGYGGAPVEVREKAAEKYVAPVEEGMARLVEVFGEGSPFPALPDMEGGGLLPTGHCKHCALAGVCRRQEMAR